jgi:glycosyltransferase involved in cell wall biosynthesis
MNIASQRVRIEGGQKLRGSSSRRSGSTTPLVSIITAVHNGRYTLEQTIQSVLKQTYGNIEYIIIDGASTDGTVDIIRKYDERINYWISEPDKGIYDAMNKGIRFAHGVLIGLLNSDDYYEDQAIQTVVNAYIRSENKENVIFFGNFYVLDEGSGIKTEHISTVQYWRGMTINHQTMFVSRDIYFDKYTYNVTYKYAADYDFFIRSALNMVHFVHTGRFLVNFRNTGATYRNVLPIYMETLLIGRNYLGTYNIRYILMVLKFVRVLLQIMIKRFISMLFGPNIFKYVKIIQNRIQGKTWHDVP